MFVKLTNVYLSLYFLKKLLDQIFSKNLNLNSFTVLLSIRKSVCGFFVLYFIISSSGEFIGLPAIKFVFSINFLFEYSALLKELKKPG